MRRFRIQGKPAANSANLSIGHLPPTENRAVADDIRGDFLRHPAGGCQCATDRSNSMVFRRVSRATTLLGISGPACRRSVHRSGRQTAASAKSRFAPRISTACGHLLGTVAGSVDRAPPFFDPTTCQEKLGAGHLTGEARWGPGPRGSVLISRTRATGLPGPFVSNRSGTSAVACGR